MGRWAYKVWLRNLSGDDARPSKACRREGSWEGDGPWPGTECSWVKERGVNKQSQRQRADQQSAGAGAGGERGRVRLCETHCVLVVVRSRASSAAARGKSAIVALEN